MSYLERNSKILALILRHKPQAGNVALDEHGWCIVDDLVKFAGFKLKDVHEIVRTDNKSRYELSQDNKKVRAVQGHSVHIDAELQKCTPPKELYHGTKESVKMEIAKKGLLPMNRLYVHLTTELKTAQETADRRKGKSIILKIDSASMSNNGYTFFKSKNNVWLVSEVPKEFISELQHSS